MTEQQAQSPIDDLFRKTFEELPNSPAESGWDTPSERVWEQVQANIAKPKKGWGTQSLVLMAILFVTLAAGLYWMFARASEKPVSPPVVTPIEQPVATPSAGSQSPVENQPEAAPKVSQNTGSAKDTPDKPAPRNTTGASNAKPGSPSAQPLPGSKNTLPPNSTEAEKEKQGGN